MIFSCQKTYFVLFMLGRDNCVIIINQRFQMNFNTDQDDASHRQLKFFFSRAEQEFDNFQNIFQPEQRNIHFNFQVSNSIEQLPYSTNNFTFEKPQQEEKDRTHVFDLQSFQSMKKQENYKEEIVVSREAKQKRIRCMKGRGDQTDNLGQQFKNLTLPLLRVMECSNLIEKSQQARIKKFKASNGSIEQFKQLFKNKAVAEFCCEYFSSTSLVKNILKSERTKLKNKLIAIKYLKSLRKITHQSIRHWKVRQQ